MLPNTHSTQLANIHVCVCACQGQGNVRQLVVQKQKHTFERPRHENVG